MKLPYVPYETIEPPNYKIKKEKNLEKIINENKLYTPTFNKEINYNPNKKNSWPSTLQQQILA
jgi:hypothetical protein